MINSLIEASKTSVFAFIPVFIDIVTPSEHLTDITIIKEKALIVLICIAIIYQGIGVVKIILKKDIKPTTPPNAGDLYGN